MTSYFKWGLFYPLPQAPPTGVLGGSKSKTDVIFGFAIPENIEINIHHAIWRCLNFVVCVLSYSSTRLNQFINNKQQPLGKC